MPVALIDILAAHQMKEAILIALIKKLKTGKGSKVSVSLFDAAIASLANQASNWLMTGENPQPIGSLHPTIAPYGELFKDLCALSRPIIEAPQKIKESDDIISVSEPWCIVGDDSGHDYLIPKRSKDQFYEWVTATENGEEYEGEDFNSYRIDSPSHLEIFSWKES